MLQIDFPALTNFLMSGFIGLISGIIGGWAKYRFDRDRDDRAWEREKEKLRQNWEHEKELLEIQFKQRLEELGLKSKKEDEQRVREYLTKGIENFRDEVVKQGLRHPVFQSVLKHEVMDLSDKIQHQHSIVAELHNIAALQDQTAKNFANAVQQLITEMIKTSQEDTRLVQELLKETEAFDKGKADNQKD